MKQRNFWKNFAVLSMIVGLFIVLCARPASACQHIQDAPAQEFIVFDGPNAFATHPAAINNRGDVTGYFVETVQGKGFHAFVRDQNGNFAVFDAPDAYTGYDPSPQAINNRGDVAGILGGQVPQHAFVRDASGDITVFDAPNARTFTIAVTINDRGDVVGTFDDATRAGAGWRGFVRDASGNITIFDAPNASISLAQSINDGGEVTGSTSNIGTPGRGFVRDANGNSTVFDAPNAVFTVASSINNRGDVTGFFLDKSQQNRTRGFVRDRAGNITVLDVGNTNVTEALAINNRGEVAGKFRDPNDLFHRFRGFVFRSK